MSGNGKITCTKCGQDLKVLKSGLGQFHLQCGCGNENQGFCDTEVAHQLGLDVARIRRIAIDLMVTDVCI